MAGTRISPQQFDLSNRTGFVLFFALAILGGQFYVSAMWLDVEPFIDREEPWLQALLIRGTVVKAMLVQAVLMGLVMRSRLREHLSALLDSSGAQISWSILAIQCTTFAASFWLAAQLYTDPFPFTGWHWPVLIGWLSSMLVALVLAFLVFAPASYWIAFIRRESKAVLLGFAFLASYLLVFQHWIDFASDWLWANDSPLRLATLKASAHLLTAIYPELLVDIEGAILGNQSFAVFISNECAGIEGVVLLTALVSAYLYFFRQYLKFPQALALLAIAIPLSLCANVLRIVALVMVGIEWSPHWAMEGFHTYGGVVVVVFESALLIALSNTRWFSRKPARFRFGVDFETALLLPLLVLLAATLLTGLFTVQFNWGYPVRVLLVAATLLLCWRALKPICSVPSGSALAIGVIVAPIWILMIPADPAEDALFAASLFSASPWLIGSWMVLRLIGTCLTVPIAEELAFRGYLLSRLAGAKLTPDAGLPFSWFALIGTSLLFGALHGQWLAGSIAGLAYGWVRYRSGRLIDAIAAHATTNALLSLYVLATGHWSYW